jgi:hypothetical protein
MNEEGREKKEIGTGKGPNSHERDNTPDPSQKGEAVGK